MKTILVNVKTENPNDGCYSGAFGSLDEVREFIKASTASFRNWKPNLKCTAFILRNGTPVSTGRTIEC
jgi:hypothetical protein